MTHVDVSKLSKFHKAQISHLQQAIFSLETAIGSVKYAIGNSDLGKCYIANLDVMIEQINDDIDNIWAEYD
jgi:hypothetical protein